ncbi:MAG: peptidyl-prolyl cis-trans isomerase [Aquificota bacterium]|nr:MAG: peptidyl-prolyl cis-trans isomerase [Aquificota bacterium]
MYYFASDILVEYVRSKIIQKEARKMRITVTDSEFEDYIEKNIGSKRLSPVVKELILSEILADKIARSLYREANIKEGQITAYYYLNLRDFKRPSQVLLERYMAENLETANEVYYRLSRGQPIRGLKGVKEGQPMWYSIQTLPYLVKKELGNFQIGAVTKPIQVGDGYVIFRLADKRGSGIIPLEEAKPLVMERLLREKRQEVLKKWFQEVSKQYSLEFYFGQR